MTAALRIDNGVGYLTGSTRLTLVKLSQLLAGRRSWQGAQLVFSATAENLTRVYAELPTLAPREEPEELRHTLPTYQWRTEPYTHQRQAFDLSRNRRIYGLFFDRGLGKTKVTLDTALDLFQRGRIKRVLIVAPNGVHTQWLTEELPRHLPDAPVHAQVWQGRDKWKGLDKTDNLHFLAMNYEALLTEQGYPLANAFLRGQPTMLVVDESSRIKNYKAKRTKTLTALGKAAIYRRILTGTAVTQGSQDLFAQLRFLSPDITGCKSFLEYRSEYCETEPVWVKNSKTGKAEIIYKITGPRNVAKLQALMAPHVMKATKEEYLPDLPEKIYIKRYVELTPEQKKHYNEIALFCMTEIGGGRLLTVDNILTELLRLQQIVGGWLPENDVVEQMPLPSNRLEMIQEIVEEEPEEVPSKFVIWSRFRNENQMIAGALPGSVLYMGGVKDADRKEAIDRFRHDPACRFFVGSQQSAGTGLNLVPEGHSVTVIYYSNSFSLEDRLQSEDRVHRIGQKHVVRYIDLVAENTIDTHILATLNSKLNVANVTVGDLKKWIRKV